MYTVRIFDAVEHTDTEYATEDLAFGAIYLDSLPLPAETPSETKEPFYYGYAIYNYDGVCVHRIGDRADIGDPL